jgi:hypothetical protein
MPIIQDLFPSFNTGELSPRLSARLDFAKYKSGTALMQNLIPLSEGGAMRRAGSRFVQEVKTSSNLCRLKSFEFSTTQAYILELGNQYMRFYKEQGQINAEDVEGSVTNGTFDSGISGWTDLSAGTANISHDDTLDRMDLNDDGTNAGHAEQEITNTTATSTVIKFEVDGAPGDTVTLQVGTSTGASDLKSFEAKVGFHAIAVDVTAANFFLQFVGMTDKTVSIDNISIIDDAAIEIGTPWVSGKLETLEGPQSADVLYLFHADYPTYKLERRGDTTWSLVEVPWEDGPYLPTNTTTTTMTPAATTGKAITVTASSTTGVNDGRGFLAIDIGRSIRIDNPASGVDWGWGVIVGRTSSTIVTVDVKHDFANVTADVNWRLGAWSSTTGYPANGAFFEQRLFAANTTDQPQTFWASQTADFELHRPDSDPNTDDQFDGTVEDDDAIDYTISADDVNAIMWLSAGEDTLAIGTVGGEWVPSSVGAVLTPSDINVKRQVSTKAAKVQPIRVDNVVLFVQRAKRKVIEFGFAFEVDGFQSIDMTRLAQHIGVGGITEMSWAEEPESQVYAVRGDGTLLSMTFRRNEDVVGWTRHVLGGRFVNGTTVTATDISFTASGDTISSVAGDFGKFVAGDVLFIDGSTSNDFADIGLVTISSVSDDHTTITLSEDVVVDESAGASITITAMSQAEVESVTTIPGSAGSGQTKDSTARDEVWVIVKRTINGTTKRYIEVVEKDFDPEEDDQEDSYYSDSLITYDGVSTSTITGLTHLEGETVKILADGGSHADKTVSSGSITLDAAAKVVQVGLGYTHKLKLLRMTGGNAAGTAIGKTKRITGLNFSLLNTHVLKFGPNENNLKEVDFREISDAMDEASPVFTGDYFSELEGEWDDDPRVLVQNDSPSPFTLLALAPEERLNAVK